MLFYKVTLRFIKGKQHIIIVTPVETAFDKIHRSFLIQENSRSL